MSQPFMSPHLQIEQLDTIKELLDYIKSKHKNPRNYAGVSANTLNLLWKEVSQYDLTMDAEDESNLLLQIEYVQSLISSQVSERGSDDQLHSTLKTIEDKAVLDGDKPTELYAGLQNLLHKIRVLPLTAAPSSSPPSEHTKCSSQEQKRKLLLSYVLTRESTLMPSRMRMKKQGASYKDTAIIWKNRLLVCHVVLMKHQELPKKPRRMAAGRGENYFTGVRLHLRARAPS